jgi:hypothetical protein
MADPLGGDQFDNEALAEAEIEKLLKQVRKFPFCCWCEKILLALL